MIPYGKQDINQDDIDAVVEVLKSDYLTQGPKVPQFEDNIIEYCGCEFAIAVNSATSALHIACLALDVGKNDIVWTSPISYVASANCALYCSAKIDFVDIDPVTYNLSTIKLQGKLEHAVRNNLQLPKVVIPVHLSGQSCDMEAIYALSKKYDFSIVEDASHAIGGRYKGKPVGNCKFSDITIFSFHPVKIVTSAEGGMATTNNAEIADKMSLLRNHGVTREAGKMTEKSHGDWYYQQIALGYNYRMTDLQAALGVSQMKRLNEFVNKRNEIAKLYNKSLNELPVILPVQQADSISSSHLYIIRLKLNELGLSHREIFNKLRDENLGVNLHYIPIHMQPYYQQKGFREGYLPEAEKYYTEAISLPLYSQMTEEEIEKVINVLSKILKESLVNI